MLYCNKCLSKLNLPGSRDRWAGVCSVCKLMADCVKIDPKPVDPRLAELKPVAAPASPPPAASPKPPSA